MKRGRSTGIRPLRNVDHSSSWLNLCCAVCRELLRAMHPAVGKVKGKGSLLSDLEASFCRTRLRV